MAEIYALLELGTRRVRYVGCSVVSAEARRNSHWSQRNSQGRTPVKDWLVTLPEPPEFWIFQEVPDEQAQAAETYWTEMIRQTSVGPDLLNVLDGRNWLEQPRQKLSRTQQGTKLSEETKRKISQSQAGKKHSEESIEKIRLENKRQDFFCKKCDSGPFTRGDLGRHSRWKC